MFCRAGFVDTYCENLALSLNILLSFFIVIENFAGIIALAGICGLLVLVEHLSRNFLL